MEKALFYLKEYSFDKLILDLEGLNGEEAIALSFDPRGTYSRQDGSFALQFVFTATVDNKPNPIVLVLCNAVFQFKEVIPFDDIPDYFFSNSIAILFPYIRAMVSTLTLQANVKPIVLPTMNLSALKEQLRKQTTIV